MMQNKRISGQKGFTIVELLIVIIVIGILAAIGLVQYVGMQDRAREAVLRSDLTGAAEVLNIDQVRTSSYPEESEHADRNNGLPASADTTYRYDANNAVSPPTFCLTGFNGSLAMHITQEGVVRQGTCAGHSDPGGDDDDDGGGGGGTLACGAGYIPVPGNSHYGTSDFCVAKYEAKHVGGVATSQAAGTPWIAISQMSAIFLASQACATCHLITEAEWMTVATDVMGVASNWSGGSVGSGFIYSGHTNSNPGSALPASANDDDGMHGYTGGTGSAANHNNRRTLMLSNGEVIWDLAGNVAEWTNSTIAGGQQPGLLGESTYIWKDYSNSSLQWGGLPATSRPVGTFYPRTQGVGGLHSNRGEVGVRATFRGGYWNNASNAGVLTLHLTALPGSVDAGIGFRVAK